ncbi:hypothetical protein [Miltoncostaea oceani]|uniref:hypothetical protein n=1 Tax=Miltoncostaea oceani TaxID=2843216 RepID=UPI001C3C6A14|nr:hypothetical protein [Miltoncostaea oceani]
MDVCPLCGGALIDIRAKAVCSACGRICEGCCEGAPDASCPPAGVGRSPAAGRNGPATAGEGR